MARWQQREQTPVPVRFDGPGFGVVSSHGAGPRLPVGATALPTSNWTPYKTATAERLTCLLPVRHTEEEDPIAEQRDPHAGLPESQSVFVSQLTST